MTKKDIVIQTVDPSGFLTVSKTAIKQLGMFPAVLLSLYISKSRMFENLHGGFSGWFYLKHENIVSDLGMSEKTLRHYKTILIQEGYLKTTMRGCPPKQWFWIDYDKVHDSLFPILPKREGMDTQSYLKGEECTYIDKEKLNIKEKYKKKSSVESKESWKDSTPWDALVERWLEYKKERGEAYKAVSSIKSFRTTLKKLSKGDPKMALEIIKQSKTHNWAGVYALKTDAPRTTPALQPRNGKKCLPQEMLNDIKIKQA